MAHPCNQTTISQMGDTGDNGVGNETLIIREPHIPPEPVTEKVIQVLTNIDELLPKPCVLDTTWHV